MTERETTIEEWARLSAVMPRDDKDCEETDCNHLSEYKRDGSCLRCQQETSHLYDGLLDATEGRSAGRTPSARGGR